MKSLNRYITEKRNNVSLEIDGSTNWGTMTCGVDYSGEPVIIFGEPCSRNRQDAWDQAYKCAKQIGGRPFSMAVYQNLEKAFNEIEDEIGEKLDNQQCLCICYIPTHDEWAVYVYGSEGVMAVK